MDSVCIVMSAIIICTIIYHIIPHYLFSETVNKVFSKAKWLFWNLFCYLYCWSSDYYFNN